MKNLPCILLCAFNIFSFHSVAEPDIVDALDALDGPNSINMHQFINSNIERFIYNQAMERFDSEDRNIHVDASDIDPRISIPKCLEGFRFHVEPEELEKSQFTARIACESQDWYTYSTVKLSFTQNIVVTNGTLSPNTVLRRDNLRLEEIDMAKMRYTGFRHIEDVLGATLKQRIRDGQSLQKKMLCYVCEGDRITIAVRVGGMIVKTTGIAQEDGTLGDTIEVMNIRSKKMVFAQVNSTQEVIVSL